MNDQQLIEGCLRKDKRSEKALFNKYSQRMYTICRRYARHDAEAEDILQDALIKVYDNIKNFRAEGSLEAWIRRIVVNTALKMVSKSSFQKEQLGMENYQEAATEPRAFRNLSAEELMGLIARLPDGYRIVFNLAAIEGYTHKEIGAMLGIQESTSRSQLTKARKMLQSLVLKQEKITL